MSLAVLIAAGKAGCEYVFHCQPVLKQVESFSTGCLCLQSLVRLGTSENIYSVFCSCVLAALRILWMSEMLCVSVLSGPEVAG